MPSLKPSSPDRLERASDGVAIKAAAGAGAFFGLSRSLTSAGDPAVALLPGAFVGLSSFCDTNPQ